MAPSWGSSVWILLLHSTLVLAVKVELVSDDGRITRQRLAVGTLSSFSQFEQEIRKRFSVEVEEVKDESGHLVTELSQLISATVLKLRVRKATSDLTTSSVRALYEALPYPPERPNYVAYSYSKDRTKLERTGFGVATPLIQYCN